MSFYDFFMKTMTRSQNKPMTNTGVEIPVISSLNIRRRTCDKPYFLVYIYLLVDESFPLNSV